MGGTEQVARDIVDNFYPVDRMFSAFAFLIFIEEFSMSLKSANLS